MDHNERVFRAAVWLETLHQFNDEGFAYLAADQPWSEMTFKLSEATSELVMEWISDAIEDERDLYFTPRTFRGPRSNDAATSTRLLYADLDHIGHIAPTPWMRWVTSPGSSQAIWLTDEMMEPNKQRAWNRGLTYATNADRGGWAGSKLLRLPYSWSRKRGCWVQPPVMEHPAILYTGDLEPFYDALYDPDIPQYHELTANEWARYLHEHYDDIPNHIISELLTPTTDRSLKIWAVSRMCKEAGLPAETAVTLISGTRWNKWQGDINKLARDVHKAYH